MDQYTFKKNMYVCNTGISCVIGGGGGGGWRGQERISHQRDHIGLFCSACDVIDVNFLKRNLKY